MNAKKKSRSTNDTVEGGENLFCPDDLGNYSNSRIRYFRSEVVKDPNNPDSHYRLGSVLRYSGMAEKDEKKILDACKHFEKAIKLNPKPQLWNLTKIINNWGYALCYLFKTKQNDARRIKELKKFEDVSKDINNATTFLVRGELYFILKRNTDAIDCFKKSKKNILEILVFLSEGPKREILKSDILYSLLDDDEHFYKTVIARPITATDPEKLDKYKKAYISSLYIISQLHIQNRSEGLVAHYTGKAIAMNMLFNENSKLRLTAINYSNDSKEGETLFDYLFGNNKSSKDEDFKTGYRAFVGCFTFNHDSLNQFRLYGKEDGKEGTGVSIVFRDSF